MCWCPQIEVSSWTSAPSSWWLNYIQPFSINELWLLQTGGWVAPSTSSFSSLAVAAPSFGYLCHKPFLSHPTFSSLVGTACIDPRLITTATVLVQATSLSHLDYCGSLLVGLPVSALPVSLPTPQYLNHLLPKNVMAAGWSDLSWRCPLACFSLLLRNLQCLACGLQGSTWCGHQSPDFTSLCSSQGGLLSAPLMCHTLCHFLPGTDVFVILLQLYVCVLSCSVVSIFLWPHGL